jgi:hypothetical protein
VDLGDRGRREGSPRSSGEPAPDAIVSLWKDAHATLIALQSLARHEVEDLVCSVLAGPIDGTLLQLLWESSKGNAKATRTDGHLAVDRTEACHDAS